MFCALFNKLRLVCIIFAPRWDTCSTFSDTFAVFPVLSLRVRPRTIKVSQVRKNTRLSPPAQLQCLRSGAEKPGNKARLNAHVHFKHVFPAIETGLLPPQCANEFWNKNINQHFLFSLSFLLYTSVG